jgi:HlyD family secretion protein
MRVLALLLLAGAVAAGVFWYTRRHGEEVVSYRTAAVRRGDLLVSVNATGTVEPEELVDVGAQVAGQILSFGHDEKGKVIDYGSAVEQGTVLAQIDDSLYAADVASAEAAVEQARAGVARAEADLGQLRAQLVLAGRNWTRAKKLGPSEALAQGDYDAYESAFEVATASVTVGEAALRQAKAAVAGAEATLTRAQRDLGYCTIRSPVRGVIIDRRVNIGQTVVSSLNAPSLFLIAKDLTRIQVWVSVNEADIGHITPGMQASFTVDAFPGQVFRGVVGKIRLNATMTQNVVTYTVEVVTDNRDGKLLPYLTANVEFEIRRDRDVLLVPNAALRWTPAPDRILPGLRTPPPSATPTPPVTPPAETQGEAAKGTPHGTLWVVEGRYVRPIQVVVGPTDGTSTEVSGEGVTEGLPVAIGENAPASSRGGGDTTPFAPQPFRRTGSS